MKTKEDLKRMIWSLAYENNSEEAFNETIKALDELTPAMPSDEEIKKEFERREKLNRDAMTGESPTFKEGAKWMRDKLTTK